MNLEDTTPAWLPITDDDGSGLSGTIDDAAFWTNQRNAINSLINDPGNPSVTPAAIIAEVVAARGNLGSLDDRISGVIDDDGNLLAPASLLAQADYQIALGAENLASNNDLSTWSNGAAAAPDGFVLSGAGATIARTGAGEVDTYSFGAGQYAARVTRAGADSKLTQTVFDATAFAKYTRLKGRKVAVVCLGKSASASQLRIVIDDGAATSASDYHAGDAAAAVLSKVHTISNSASKLEFRVEHNNSNGDVYVGGFIVIFSQVAPTDWNYFNQPVHKSGAEDVFDVKTFRAHPLYVPGTSTTPIRVSGRFTTLLTPAQATNGVPADAGPFTLGANLLDVTGRAIRVRARFSTNVNAAVKKLDFSFGGVVTTLVADLADSDTYVVEIVIYRTGLDTQTWEYRIELTTSNAMTVGEVNATLDDGANIDCKFVMTVTGAGGTIDFKRGIVEVLG